MQSIVAISFIELVFGIVIQYCIEQFSCSDMWCTVSQIPNICIYLANLIYVYISNYILWKVTILFVSVSVCYTPLGGLHSNQINK